MDTKEMKTLNENEMTISSLYDEENKELLRQMDHIFHKTDTTNPLIKEIYQLALRKNLMIKKREKS